jgi:hypothetical protein
VEAVAAPGGGGGVVAGVELFEADAALGVVEVERRRRRSNVVGRFRFRRRR